MFDLSRVEHSDFLFIFIIKYLNFIWNLITWETFYHRNTSLHLIIFYKTYLIIRNQFLCLYYLYYMIKNAYLYMTNFLFNNNWKLMYFIKKLVFDFTIFFNLNLLPNNILPQLKLWG